LGQKCSILYNVLKLFFQTALNIVCKSADQADKAGTTSRGSNPVAGYLKEPSPGDRFHSRWFLPAKTFSKSCRVPKETSDGSDDSDCVERVKGEPIALEKSRPSLTLAPPKIGSLSRQFSQWSGPNCCYAVSIRLVQGTSRLRDAVSG